MCRQRHIVVRAGAPEYHRSLSRKVVTLWFGEACERPWRQETQR